MKLTEYKRDVTEQGTLSEAMFGISENDQVHIISILRSKLYSNKPLAVLREYAANARDANVEAGYPDRPINIHLPTRFEPYLSIRDFGLGLSKQDVYEIYCQYGKSTKRSSNLVVGQLGLGSKSAFCYTDTFVITSYNQGMKTSYCAFIDPTGVGKISELASVASSEETGIEIQIAVDLKDIELFKQEALKLFSYFEPAPNINIQLEPPKYIAKAEQWGIRQSSAINGPVAVMGGIPYPIDRNKVNLHDTGNNRDILFTLLSSNIDVFCEIGDLSITASREALEYTPVTQDSIKKILLVIHSQMHEELAKQFALIKTAWEARLWFWAGLGISHKNSYSSHTPLSRIIANNFNIWQSKQIDNRHIHWADKCGDKITARYFSSDRVKPESYANGVSRRGRYQVTLWKDLVIVKVDSDRWHQRFLHFRSKNSVDAIVIDYKLKDKTELDFDIQIAAYCEAHSITGITILKTSDMELPEETVAATPKASTSYSIKAKSKLFKIKSNYNRFQYPYSDNWENCEIDITQEAGPYIVLHKFLPVGTDIKDVYSQQDLLDVLFVLGFDPTTQPIYGVRRELVSELDARWQQFTPWAKETVSKTLLSNQKVRQNILNTYIRSTYSLENRYTPQQTDEWLSFVNACRDKRFVQLLSLYRVAKADNTVFHQYHSVFNKLHNKDLVKDIIKEAGVFEQILQDYPLLETMSVFSGGTIHLQPSWPKTISDYVNSLYQGK